MKRQGYILLIFFLILGESVFCQSDERFDIASYAIPAGWVKDTGDGFVAYTTFNNATNEYARILLFKSLAGTGNVNTDFDTEWQELVKLNYKPGGFTNASVTEYKEGWISKIGVSPFQFQNKNHAVILLTLVKGQTKMSSVFISNTTTYQTVFENFGSSLNFGQPVSNSVNQSKPQRSVNQASSEPQTAFSTATQQNRPSYSQSSGYTFTTSNFDDGWTAIVQNDWVLVEKGNAKVYLYYVVPYNSDNFSGTGLMDRDYYWDNYVARQFSITSKQYNDAGEFISSLKPKYVDGWGKDPATGASRFLAMTLYVSPNAAQLTVASYPDEASFRQAFPNANDKYTSDLTKMNRYNKFAIGMSDFLGTWQSGGTQMTQWYDAITGSYAGATMAASSATFSFQPGNIYSSIHNGATGAIGAMNTFQQEYKGSNTVSNWSMVLTNRWQGKTHNFDAHYQAVRGGRLLYLNDNAGSNYLLVKIK